MAQTDRQTDTQTDGHGDSMTNSAQWGRVGEKRTYPEFKKVHNGKDNDDRSKKLKSYDVDVMMDKFDVMD